MENRTVVLALAINLNDAAITEEEIVESIRRLGGTRTMFIGSYEKASLEECTNEIVIYVPADDEKPYQKVSSIESTEGTDLSDDEIIALQEKGVCVGFHINYPRASRYGTPLAATGLEEFAAAVVGEHRFRVANDDVEFKISSRNTGDDSCEEYWFLIRS